MLIVDHPRNLGLPAAMRTAIEQFLKEAGPQDALVTMDADDTHDPEEIVQMLERLQGGADIVIGSRFQPGARVYGVSPLRNALSRGVLLFMRLLAPLPGVRDYSCGYRMYSARILEEAERVYGNRLIQTKGFSVQSELLIKCAASGARIEEVPMVLHYDRKIGKSKIKIGNTLAGYIRLISIYRAAFSEKSNGG
jgi:dolichol-phosphate mannosyltransferase